MIRESDISAAQSIPDLEKDIQGKTAQDASLLQQTVVLKLNGGLGTSMGLDKAKSLLEVKGGNTFLDLTAKQVISMRKNFKTPVAFMLMNSFNTSKDTLSFLAKYPVLVDDPKIELMQNKVPKIVKGNRKRDPLCVELDSVWLYAWILYRFTNSSRVAHQQAA